METAGYKAIQIWMKKALAQVFSCEFSKAANQRGS